jgi:putative sterol carrier protein
VGPPVDAPDLTLRLSYATAQALATGQRTAHEAFLAGEVKVAGDFGRLESVAADLATLVDDVLR